MIDVEINSIRWLNIEDLPNEKWKDIPNYEGLYQISNYGRVKSLSTKIIRKSQRHERGHYDISLKKNGVRKIYKVHRLVALAFIPNPHNVSDVDHIEPITKDFCNNMVSNLRWATHYENMRHSKNVGRAVNPPIHYGIDNYNHKKIVQFSLDGVFIKNWDYMSQIHNELGIDCASVCMVCKGKRHHAGGYKWLYGEYIDGRLISQKHRKIVQYDMDGKLIKKWNSTKEIHDECGYNIRTIQKSCRGLTNTSYGYEWRYEYEN